MNQNQKDSMKETARTLRQLGKRMFFIWGNPGKISIRDTTDIGIIASDLQEAAKKLERIVGHYEQG